MVLILQHSHDERSSKSRTIPAIIEEAERLVGNGTKELLVIAQVRLIRMGSEKKVYLSDLLRELNQIDDLSGSGFTMHLHTFSTNH